jgi:ribosomal protein S18 acetylase RimI-like enzyme
MIEIVDFRPEHQPFFEKFNRAWIEEHYELEPVDMHVLQHPDEAILNNGGSILMALYKGQVAGTVALRKVDNETFEFTKMAVDAGFRRRGIAEALSYASFKKARKLGAATVILYSNTLQAAAIRLYEKLGFQHLPVEKGVYKRANVKMKIELDEVLNKNNKKTTIP